MVICLSFKLTGVNIMRFFTASLFLLFLAGSGYGGSIHYVPTHYSTIQSAINAASDGDVVFVYGGTYVECIDFLGKDIIVTSPAGAYPVIDGNNRNSVVKFHNNEPSTSLLYGFTIKNGKGSPNGGGIYIDHANPVIEHCIITENSADKGGGIYLNHSNSHIRDNEISYNNVTEQGGGICVHNGSPNIRDNQIKNNRCDSSINLGILGGGGLFATGYSTRIILYNNTFEFNYALVSASTFGGGGGLYCIDCGENDDDNEIFENTFIGNITSSKGGGILIQRNGSATPRYLIVKNKISGNQAVSGHGGGIYAGKGFNENPINNLHIINNLITGNLSLLGGGVMLTDCHSGNLYMQNGAELIHNTIAGNRVSGVPLLDTGGAIHLQESKVYIRNSILWNNRVFQPNDYEIYLEGNSNSRIDIDYCDLEAGSGAIGIGGSGTCMLGGNMIDINPKFTSSWDFHLEWDSPCINRGDHFTSSSILDIDNESRTYGSTVDLGADEYNNTLALDASTSTYMISYSNPSPIQFDLKAGVGNANKHYRLLACVTGYNPGGILPSGINLPINWDVYTDLMFPLINTPAYQNFEGVLDSVGNATAVFNSSPLPNYGFFFTFAYYLGTNTGLSPATFASNPTDIYVSN